jgi:DNA-binding IscR family transcriptional regulator
MEALDPILKALEQFGLLTRTGHEPPEYLPARPLDTTELKEVLDAVRRANEMPEFELRGQSDVLAVDQLIDHLDQSVAEALRGSTLKELALSEPSPVAPVEKEDEQQAAVTGQGRET